MEEKIKNLIKDALQNLDIEVSDIALEHSEDLKNGDYSTNVAMVVAKSIKTNPKELAQKIVVEILRLNLDKNIEKVEVAGSGFVNFYLSPEFFAESIKEILEKGEKFGQNSSFAKKKIMTEHTDPNPFKRLHVGHLMPMTIGETIAHIFEWSGAEVKQACYMGDVGLHVAKAVWALKNSSKLEEAYAFGNKKFEEDEKIKKEIQDINKKLYDRSDEKINSIYDAGKKESLKYFDSIYKILNVKFDYFFFESEAAGIGKEIVVKNKGKVFEESDGAVIFKAEKYDPSLHTRVFVNSEGLPTYEAKELGLAKIKYEKYKYDQSVIITGNEINDYFRVLLCAMKQIFPELAEKTIHLSHGMLRLPSGKMSSRTGDVITAEQLIDTVKEKVKGDEMIAIGAIKYMILRQSVGGNIIFDIEKSISTEGDSGVYLQYSHVRAKSILGKAKDENLVLDTKLPKNWQTTELEKLLYRFPEIVLHSMKEFAPHHIVNFLTELARSYNSFYGNTKIINKDDSSSSYKIALSQAFSFVMKNGLFILGIGVPEKM